MFKYTFVHAQIVKFVSLCNRHLCELPEYSHFTLISTSPVQIMTNYIPMQLHISSHIIRIKILHNVYARWIC